MYIGKYSKMFFREPCKIACEHTGKLDGSVQFCAWRNLVESIVVSILQGVMQGILQSIFQGALANILEFVHRRVCSV